MPSRQVLRYVKKQDSNRTSYKHRERIIQSEIASRLNTYGIPFFNDWASGAYLTYGQNDSRRKMASDQGWVDHFTAIPRNGYHGHFVEYKKEDVRVYKKDGNLVADPQIQKEAAFLEKMRLLGYKADFGIGLENSWRLHCEYLGLPIQEELF